jgi:phage major head subunit gpT-like protein
MSHASAAPAEQVVTRDLPSLSLRASFRPGSIDVEKRTVELVWTTGAKVLRRYYGETFYEELSVDPKHVRLGRLNDGAPLLDTHQGYELRHVIGVVEPGSAKVDGKRGTAVVRFAKAEDDPAADTIFRKVQDGIIQNVSVGYGIHKLEKIEDAEQKIPTYRAIDWEPAEISFVPMGADAAAGVRAEAPGALTPCEFITRQMEQSMKNETPAAAAATVEETRAAASTTANETEIRTAAQAAERERCIGIRQAVRAAKLSDTVADKLIADGTALDAARASVLEQLAAADASTRTTSTVAVIAGEDARDKFMRGAASWLLIKGGMADVVARAEKTTADKLEPGEFRGLSLLDLARHCLEQGGVNTRGMDKMRLVGQAFMHRSGITQSTSDFATLLENVMHKILQASYATAPDTWSKWCNRSTVSDFRAHNRYRMGMFGALDALTETGEFKNKPINDAEKASITAATKGNIINVSRQMIVNDDMGAFARLLSMLGRAAGLSVEIDAYAELLKNSGLGPTQSDSQPLFHANRVNVGTGAALSVNALDADRIVMASQKDPWGNEYLDLRPAVLLVPIGLGGQARVTNDAQYDVDASNKFQVPNKVRGLFREVVDTPRITGTRRYLFADPSVAPVFEVAFLEGQTEPVLESQDGWRVDGTEMKVRFDYGVAAVDYRGAVTNAGA